ncbi:HNH endonuclease [Phyllobacterium sp. TAF24]|uniref:HNH endonuclease n=1 Tax=Phyllobacterium sp. TAF24 TaxID=3233068 RepID=UPI003F981C64
MNSATDYYVFEKWAQAPIYAFGRKNETGVVPTEDKDAYWRVYRELYDSVSSVLDNSEHSGQLFLRPKQYSRERGSRGHRPVDLWVSLCFKGAEVLGFMPQIYVIASARGLEVGFAASIAEDDYFDPKTKERNRSIVPFINSKLPQPDDQMVRNLDDILKQQGGWHFNLKTRLTVGDQGFNAFGSMAQMLGYLKSDGEDTGSGTICRIFDLHEIADVNFAEEFRLSLENFIPLLARCAPTSWDTEIRSAQNVVGKLADEVEFDPADRTDGRQKVWTELARRQGQAVFRRDLLEAYEGACAISGTDVSDVLQAAHILPYNGPKTNHVTNGLLLRADIHNLFDLKLITINPETMRVQVSPRLHGTIYWDFDGKSIVLPEKPVHHPNLMALTAHFNASAR